MLNSYTLKNDSKVKESLTVAVDVEDWQSNKERVVGKYKRPQAVKQFDIRMKIPARNVEKQRALK